MSDALSRLAASLADRYTIERELGAGGMATVYLAEDLKHHRKVAIKVLRPELAAVIGAERFLAEITTTANLQHPHILPLHDSGEVNGTVFYVMPFVEGESLRDRLVRERQLPIDDATRIASEVASALDYAHRHGVIHRDVKPENILLHDGRALVADFGIALAASKSGGGTRMTETGMSLGTPHYMSPEQAMGERDLDARTDIYAVGCVLYEMLTGEPPFTGPTAQAIVARVMTEEARPLALQRKTIPRNVDATVVQSLQKLPADRFATAAQFVDALHNPSFGAQGSPSGGVTTGAARPSRRWVRVAPWALAIAGLGFGLWGRLGRAPADAVSWQAITLGDTLGISTYSSALALSPDGRTLVFRDARQNGLLWRKRSDQLDPTPIAGTERSASPAFSPDGEWLAFVADGKVKKIRPDGGAAITLTDSAGPIDYGITWLADGSIVYASPGGDELRRVSGSGGASTPAVSDTALRGYGLINPTSLPASRGVIFLRCTSGCVTMSLFVADLRTGRYKLLIDDAYQGWYLPTGYLLYIRRDGAALMARFDLGKQEITGPAIPVLDRVLINIANPQLAWSPAGTLLFVRGVAASSEQEIVRVNRQGAAAVVDTSWSGTFNSFALSPDGRRLAVGSGLVAGGLSVYLKQLAQGPFSRLTFGGQDRRPAWSPDGRLVAFVRDSGNGGSVFARLANGSGGDTLLARIDRPVQEVTWSGDGQWLVVRTDNGTAGLGDLVGLRTNGDTTPVPLVATRFTEMNPAVSHDGHWLAYTSNESGTIEVYVRPFPNTAAGHWMVSNGGGGEPVWSADGRTLYYLGAAGQLMAAEVRTAPAFEVMNRVPLFDATQFTIDPFHQSYAVSADDRVFYFARPHSMSGSAVKAQLVLVQHWFSDLNTKLKQ